ncbi:MAG: ferrous iron transport protein A [Bacteroidota bacterium]
MNHTAKRHLPLHEVGKKLFVTILVLPSGVVRSQFIRFGIVEGETVECLERLPGGTIVIRKNRQEIAIGRKLARQVLVELEKPR